MIRSSELNSYLKNVITRKSFYGTRSSDRCLTSLRVVVNCLTRLDSKDIPIQWSTIEPPILVRARRCLYSNQPNCTILATCFVFVFHIFNLFINTLNMHTIHSFAIPDTSLLEKKRNKDKREGEGRFDDETIASFLISWINYGKFELVSIVSLLRRQSDITDLIFFFL